MIHFLIVFILLFTSPVWAEDSPVSSVSTIDVMQILSSINKNPFLSKLPPPPVVENTVAQDVSQVQHSNSTFGSIVSNAVTKAVEPPKPDLTVSGMVWSQDHRQAIVNGQLVSEGDLINNARITKINRDGVWVLSHGREYVFSTP